MESVVLFCLSLAIVSASSPYILIHLAYLDVGCQKCEPGSSNTSNMTGFHCSLNVEILGWTPRQPDHKYGVISMLPDGADPVYCPHHHQFREMEGEISHWDHFDVCECPWLLIPDLNMSDVKRQRKRDPSGQLSLSDAKDVAEGKVKPSNSPHVQFEFRIYARRPGSSSFDMLVEKLNNTAAIPRNRGDLSDDLEFLNLDATDSYRGCSVSASFQVEWGKSDPPPNQFDELPTGEPLPEEC